MTLGFMLMEPHGLTKTNPFDQARSTTAVTWRKKSEGLTLKCTTKGKMGSGSKIMKVLVAIVHGHGAALCEQYEEPFTGQVFEAFVREDFENAFENSSNPRGKLFLQDGDPRLRIP